MTEDDDGHWGLFPYNVFFSNRSYKFNSAWTSRFIMHDIFEHWFEFQKPFVGMHELEPDGEIAAMGACWYYLNVLRPDSLERFFYSQNSPPFENIVGSLIMPIEDATCNQMLKLPYLRKAEYDFSELAEALVNYEFKEVTPYIKSMTPLKVERLFLWGFKAAERRIADTYENARIYDEIHDFFETLVKLNDSSLVSYWDTLTFSVTTIRREIKSWNVQLEGFGEYKWLKRGEYTNYDLYPNEFS